MHPSLSNAHPDAVTGLGIDGLLQGPFAVPPTVALAKILSSWGARLTWTAQREYAARIIRAVETHKTVVDFLTFIAALGGQGMGRGQNRGPFRAGSSGGWDGGDGGMNCRDHVG